jgi:hypothetical protein
MNLKTWEWPQAKTIKKWRLMVVVHACNPSYMERKVGRLWSEANLGKSMRPYLKSKLNQKKKKSGQRAWFNMVQ